MNSDIDLTLGFAAVVIVVWLVTATVQEYILARKNKEELRKFYEFKTKKKL